MSEQPNFKAMTDDQLCVLFRDSISDIDLRKQIYPRFLKDFEKVPGRDAKLLVMKEYLLKIKEHLSGVTKKVTPIKKNKKNLLVDNTRERVSVDNTSTSTRILSRAENFTRGNSLSVWKKIQGLLLDPEELAKLDEAFYNRLEKYTKRALFIIHVIDTYQVFCVNEAGRKAQDVKGLNISSRTVGDLLKDLFFDGFLDLEILPRTNNQEPKLYSVKGFRDNYPEKYDRAKKRYEPLTSDAKNFSSDKSLEQKTSRVEESKLKIIEENTTKVALAQKKGFAKARKIEQEEIQKIAKIKTEEHRVKTEEEQQQRREKKARELELTEKAKEARKKIRDHPVNNKVINIKYTCYACRIKRYLDKDLKKHLCPECKEEMMPILDGYVKVDGAVQYVKEFDKIEREQKREEEKTIQHEDLNPEYAEKYVDGMAELKKIYIEEKKTKNEQIAQQNYDEAVTTLRVDLLKQQTAEKPRAHAQANESEGIK